MHNLGHRKIKTNNGLKWAMGVGALSLLVAGCGTTAAQASQTKAQASSSASKVATTTNAAPIKLGTAQVNGTKTKVLQNSQGLTLYYFTKDTPTQSHCSKSSGCPSIWHPFTTSSNHVSVKGVSGTFTVVHDIHGKQMAYNGHLLYLYSGDTKAGQARGEGLLHTWWVATPSLKPLTASSSSSSSSSSSYGSSSSGSSGSSTSGSSSGGW